ncbi:nitrile hydratase subunit beta [Puniceibacterium confluentis]|uniref:nitrile hydratase subunit beta n=1 Tax=Puniceibacterium confluentis TaxID=1958944 RepID=UPI0011B4C3C7|nr:nitrile hydratase subunit beta [Puniceibacterium confluentis]
MSRVHDMGGRFGDGPVLPEPEGTAATPPVWHKRTLAITLACGALGAWPIDAARRARESLAPRDYMRFTYYEKWLAGLADLLVERGLVSRDELQGAASGTGKRPVQALTPRALTADRVAPALARGGPATRDSDVKARFAPGDAVRTRRPAANRLVPGGHTRLPGYAAGACGRVLLCHGAHVLPDSNAHGLGERPEPLYAVVFAAAELWSDPESPSDEVVLDLWQSYLEHA